MLSPNEDIVLWGCTNASQWTEHSADNDDHDDDYEDDDDDNHVDDAKVTGTDEKKIAARHNTCALLKPYWIYK